MAKRILEKLRERAADWFGTFTPNLVVGDGIHMPRSGEPHVIDRLASILPYAHMDSDGLCAIAAPDFSGYEALGYVIEITPQTGTSELMAKSLTQLFGQDTPTGTGIQVSLYGSPFIKPLTDNLRDSCAQAKEGDSEERKRQLELMQGTAFARADFLDKGALQNPHPRLKNRVRNLRGWIAVAVPCKDPFDSETRVRVKRLAETHKAILSQMHLGPWLWDDAVLLNTVTQLLNPQAFYSGDWRPMHPDRGRPPSEQMTAHDTRILAHPDGIDFSTAGRENDKVTAVSMSARSYPERLSLGSVTNLAGSPGKTGSVYPCPFLVTTLVSVMDFESGKSRSLMKSARAEQMAVTEIAKLIPAMREEAADWRLAVKSFENGEGLVQLTHQVLLFPKASERNAAVEAARSIFREIGLETASDDFMHMQGLIGSLPMCAGPLLFSDLKAARRCTTKTAANAANTLPVVGDWRGSPPRAGRMMPTPLISFTSRRGQIVSVDPYANPNGNYNGIVVGASGSGKSVLLNEIALGALRTGGRVRIIDNGRSYEKLCAVTEGQYIEFSDEPHPDGSYDCINPFDLVTDLESDMDMLLPIMCQMVSPSKPLDDLMQSHLLIHFTEVFKKARREGRVASVTELSRSLIENWRLGGAAPSEAARDEIASRILTDEEKQELNDPRIADLGVQLVPFTENGPFGHFFKGRANINFDNHFVVLELENLKNRKALQSIVLMLLMYIIDKEMQKGDRSQTKTVIIDEAWDLMGSGHAGKFIEAGYRRARKQNGAFFTATQSPADYWKTPTAKAALENSDCIFLLRQKADVLENLKRSGQLAIDDAQGQMLSSLTTLAGVYSEVFVRIGDDPPSVNRLMLDPFSQLLMSSHPEDTKAVQEKTAMGLSMAEAIRAVLADRRVEGYC